MRIRDELNEIVLKPEEDLCVGDVILKHVNILLFYRIFHNFVYFAQFLCNFVFFAQADALLKCYPPFVNYFEKTKETIHNCDKEKPRFHAFLKVKMPVFTGHL